MNKLNFKFRTVELEALSNGALYWPAQRLLVVSDLHLGKSERLARRGGQMLPPYETAETLGRLDDAIRAVSPECVICLGDSFDDLDAGKSLREAETQMLLRLMAGRKWIWIEGNHDPGPLEFGGTHLAEITIAPLIFRHIAMTGATGEVSGHYHPKAQLSIKGRSMTRRCFLVDDSRLILPAFGAYTGGLRSSEKVLGDLMGREAKAILTGQQVHMVPMPR